MKIYLFLTSFLIVFLLSGCKKEDNNTVQLTGRWNLQKMHIEVFENELFKTSDDEFTESDMLYFIFKSNGRLEIYAEGEDTMEVSYNYSNNTLSVNNPAGEKDVWPVRILNNNSMVLVEEETEIHNSITYKIVTELHFKKE